MSAPNENKSRRSFGIENRFAAGSSESFPFLREFISSQFNSAGDAGAPSCQFQDMRRWRYLLKTWRSYHSFVVPDPRTEPSAVDLPHTPGSRSFSPRRER